MASHHKPHSTAFALGQLIRLPNVFTAIADVTMGFLFVHESLRPPSSFLLLLLASCAIYWAGMVLNDVFDAEDDRRERPDRPIPSGRITVGVARSMGWGLLVVGLVIGWFIGIAGRRETVLWWRPGMIVTGLAICVILYDGVLKNSPFGPPLMGCCRSLNVLLGMASGETTARGVLFGFDGAAITVAAAVGLYIAGVTWFARGEAGRSERGLLVGGLAVMIVGLSLLAAFPHYGDFATGARRLTFAHEFAWPLLVVLLGVSVIRRCLVAIARPEPVHVRTAVKQCLVSLIFLDAAVCLAVRAPFWWGVGILSLLIPTLVLGRWFYST